MIRKGDRVKVRVVYGPGERVSTWFQDKVGIVDGVFRELSDGTKSYFVSIPVPGQKDGKITSIHESWLTVVNKRCPMESGK